MKLMINNQYTYETEDNNKVKVGDIAILPSASWLRDVQPTWKGEITALSSNYQGYCEKVIAIIPQPKAKATKKKVKRKLAEKEMDL